MAVKQSDVVLNFKTNGEVKYAQTIKEINTVMNNAAKEYRNSINAMDKKATTSDKLALNQKKLATQLDAAREKTAKLREEQTLAANKLPVLVEKTGKLKDTLEKSKKELEQNKEKSNQLREAYDKSVMATGKMSDESQKLLLQLNKSEKATQETANKTKELQSEYDKTAKETKKVSDAHEKLPGKILDAENSEIKLNKALKDTNEQMKKQASFSDELKKNLGKMKKVGDEMASAGKKMSLVITAPTAAFTAGLIKNGVEVRKFRAQSQIYYEGLYQDTAKAKKQLDDLMTFAKTTPYSYESIVEADQIMQTFGMSTEKSQKVLEALSNTIASTGGSSADLSSLATVMGQIESSGKLSLQDMNQLVNAKIPAFKIVGNELGVSVADLRDQISKGKVTSEDAIKALTDGLMKGTDGMNGATQAYSGALGNVKQQLPGAVDSMKSAFKNLSLEIISEDVFAKLIEAVNKITEMVNSGAFTPMIQNISEGFASFLETIIKAAEWFSKLDPSVQKSIVKFGAFLVVLGPMLVGVGKLIGLIVKVVTVFGTVATAIGIPMAALLGIVAVIAAAIAAGVLLWKNWDTIKQKAKELGDAIAQKWNDLKEKTAEIWNKMWDTIIGSWQSFKEKTFKLVDDIKQGIADKWHSFIQIFIDLGHNIAEQWEKIKAKATEFWTAFSDFMKPIIDFFVRVITVPISLIKTILDGIWTLIKAAAEIAWQAITIAAEFAWNKIKDYIINPIVQAYDFIVEKLTALKEWLDLKWGEIKTSAKIVWDAVYNAMIKPIVDAYNLIKGKVIEIKDNMVSKFNEIKDNTKAKWGDIKASIGGRMSEAKAQVDDNVRIIKSNMESKFGGTLKDTKEKFNKIKDAIVDPMVKAKEKVGEMLQAIKDFFLQIKLPKFSLKTSSKTILGKEIEYPSGIGVTWNAKGAIFNKPVVAGNYNGVPQGFGEAGPEAAIPLTEENLGFIGKGIAATMKTGQAIEQHIYIDKVDANNPSDLDRMNRKLSLASKQAIFDMGGVPV